MHILIVDDEPINRYLLRHMLVQEGYQDISEASSGREAIEIASSSSPDVVLLDIVMPDISGYAVAPQLKRMAGDIYLPIIFITAHTDQHSVSVALECGGDDFLAKPFLREVLAAKLHAHARTRQLSRRTSEQNRALSYHKNKTEQEHNIVKHIFSNALRMVDDLPDNIDYHIAPATSFNGDLIRVERGPANNWYLLVGDFTGHGLASAIGALPVARAFKEMSEKGWAVPHIVGELNQLLIDILPDNMFFAACVAELSANGKQLRVWNGGMPDALVLNSLGHIAHRFESQHMALGILLEHEFESTIEQYTVPEFHRLLVYSDGVIESFDQQGKMLTDEGFELWLHEIPSVNLKTLVQRLNDFRVGSEQTDDISLLKVDCVRSIARAAPPSLPSSNWQLNYQFSVQQLQSHSPLKGIFEMLHGNSWLAHWLSDLSTIITELFVNALDHGLLKLDSDLKQQQDGFYQYAQTRADRLQQLDSGCVDLSLAYSADNAKFIVSISDSGEGFEYLAATSTLDTQALHGRGLSLLVSLGAEISVSKGGRCVTAEFALT